MSVSKILCQAADCEEEFEPLVWNAKYCSDACKQAAYRARHPERRARPRSRDQWVNSRAQRRRRQEIADDPGTMTP